MNDRSKLSTVLLLEKLYQKTKDPEISQCCYENFGYCIDDTGIINDIDLIKGDILRSFLNYQDYTLNGWIFSLGKFRDCVHFGYYFNVLIDQRVRMSINDKIIIKDTKFNETDLDDCHINELDYIIKYCLSNRGPNENDKDASK